MVTDISEPEMAEGSSTPVISVANIPMEDHSIERDSTLKSLRHKVLSTPKPMVTGPSEATLKCLREKLVSTRTPIEMTELTSSYEIAQWVDVSPEEEEEELPEFNSVEELRQWLGV
jgi:hypothetical protein